MALQFAHDLYAEGLILKDSFSISLDDLRAIGENPNGTTNAIIIGWGPEDGVVKAGSTKRWFEYFAMPPVQGENGQRNAIYNANYSTRSGFFVTDACPEEYRQFAVQFGDLLLDEYYGYSTYLGPKGLSWDDPSSETALGINGEPAWFRELVNYGTQETDCSWDQSNITNRYAAFRLGQEAEGSDVIIKYLDGDASLKEEASGYGSYNEVMKYYACQKNLQPYAFDGKWCVPALLYSEDVVDQANDAETAVNTHRNEMIAAFVTGARSLDEYDKYVQELYDMGLRPCLTRRTRPWRPSTSNSSRAGRGQRPAEESAPLRRSAMRGLVFLIHGDDHEESALRVASFIGLARAAFLLPAQRSHNILSPSARLRIRSVRHCSQARNPGAYA